MKLLVIFLIQLLIHSSRGDEYHKKTGKFKHLTNNLEVSKDYWMSRAQNYLSSSVNNELRKKTAKNIIMFLGDGMSLSTVAATRVYSKDEQTLLSFEEFPYFGLSKTYCVDSQVADSACSATSYLNEVKGNFRTIGVNANVKENQCIVDEDDYTESIASWAQKSSKATGIVTTTRVTHASPAGTFTHTPNRDWETNDRVTKQCGIYTNVRDVTHQLVHEEVGKNFKVILGGGRRTFINQTMTDEEGISGLRTDRRNLIDEWLADRNKNAKAEYVWHKQQLDVIDYDKTDYLLGLFESSHCVFNLDILNNNLQNQEPTLTDMTTAAIKILQKSKDGFFLFVEGGQIDQAHHDNKAYRALEETREFARAIDVARQMTKVSDTLIIVTSDHSHPLTYSGCAERSSDALGIADFSDFDNLPYLTLSYGNWQWTRIFNKFRRALASKKLFEC